MKQDEMYINPATISRIKAFTKKIQDRYEWREKTIEIVNSWFPFIKKEIENPAGQIFSEPAIQIYYDHDNWHLIHFNSDEEMKAELKRLVDEIAELGHTPLIKIH